jgi:hypothetical protein
LRDGLFDEGHFSGQLLIVAAPHRHARAHLTSVGAGIGVSGRTILHGSHSNELKTTPSTMWVLRDNVICARQVGQVGQGLNMGAPCTSCAGAQGAGDQ